MNDTRQRQRTNLSPLQEQRRPIIRLGTIWKYMTTRLLKFTESIQEVNFA